MFLLNASGSFWEAWITEATEQLVRAGLFFISAGIGAQEGAFLLICTVITGLSVLGSAMFVVCRIREVLWILWEFLLVLIASAGLLVPVHR